MSAFESSFQNAFPWPDTANVTRRCETAAAGATGSSESEAHAQTPAR